VISIQSGRIFHDAAKCEALTSARLTELFRAPVEVVEKDGYYHAI
jgi:ABC-type cobalamin/Fe3+-siderophores transport system ATPase subunit